MFYAESHGQGITEDIYEGGFLRYEADSMPYCDLLRFSTKKERDLFVSESSDSNSISAVDARKKHIDQYNIGLK